MCTTGHARVVQVLFAAKHEATWSIFGDPRSGSSSMRQSKCSPTRSKPARILCGLVRPLARFGIWPFTCSSSSTCISRKTNPDSIRHHRSVSPNSRTRLSRRERACARDELLGYLEHCRKQLETVMAGMTEAWVTYRKMSNGELLLYNMRHVQHHAAQLNMLLPQTTDSAPRGVSKGPQNIKVWP